MKLFDLIDIVWANKITIQDDATNELKEYDNNGFGGGNTIKRVCHVYGNRTVRMLWPSDSAKCHIIIT